MLAAARPARSRAVFVFPVRGDALLGHLVHFLGTDLDFKTGCRLR